MFVPYINFGNFKTTWILCLIHGSILFLHIVLTIIPIFLTEVSMVMLYKNQISDSIRKLYDDFWHILVVLDVHIVARGVN